MNAKHTPGPWKVRGRAGYAGHGVDDSGGKSVASFPSMMKRDGAERDANATLIAAAPDLLAALDELQEMALCAIGNRDNGGDFDRALDSLARVADEAQAVIARAQGQTPAPTSADSSAVSPA